MGIGSFAGRSPSKGTLDTTAKTKEVTMKPRDVWNQESTNIKNFPFALTTLTSYSTKGLVYDAPSSGIANKRRE